MTSTSGQSSTSSDPGGGGSGGRSAGSATAVITRIHQAEWGRLLALLVARTRRLDLVEDALAEAFARAAERWPADGVPADPPAWLYTTAHRQVVGRLRAEAVAGRKAPLLAVGPLGPAPVGADDPVPLDELPDERLQLILLCCHPALDPAGRSALALRLVMGTPTSEIARLFLVPTPTMAARITRAKRKIAAAGIPLRAPVGAALDARLEAVARTVYLAFTAGYTPGSGPDLLRADLAGEAVALAAVLHRLVPDAPAVTALLALLLLQHSRRRARVVNGRLATLAEQDRTRWNRDEILLGGRLLSGLGGAGGYAEELRLQAAIAWEHARAGSAADTDWAAIAARYAELERLTGSPVVRLNRAVAVAETEGPAAALALLAELDASLGDRHRLHAVRAELAARDGQLALARSAYAAAIERCANGTERDFLVDRLARLA